MKRELVIGCGLALALSPACMAQALGRGQARSMVISRGGIVARRERGGCGDRNERDDGCG